MTAAPPPEAWGSLHRYERYDRNPIFGRLGRSLRVQLGLYARRPRRDGGPERRFFVFAQGRTGSTLLAALLDAHPDVQCDHEILSVPVLSPLRYVQRVSLICPARVHGFRVKIYQLTDIQRMRQPREFVVALHEAGYRIIHLKRENLLRQAVSNLFALANRTYHYKTGDERRIGTISIDCRRVVEMIEKRLRYADDEERVLAGLPVHRMIYERDLLHPGSHQAALEAAFGFLGLEGVEVRSDLARSVGGKLADTVRNLAELERALRGTRFEAYLYDSRYE